MAGATASGEDMQTGRTNRANHRTTVWAERPDPDGPEDFEGHAILVVAVSGDVEDPDEWREEGGNHWEPGHTVHGTISWGANASLPSLTPGGVGVIGNGGTNQGTGVLGIGAGTQRNVDTTTGNVGLDGGISKPGGVGGIGVHGVGGNQQKPSLVPLADPGPGVVGQGGLQSPFDDGRSSHAAGVIGISGDRGNPLPPNAVTGGTGVYGQGSNATAGVATNPDGSTSVTGPVSPGTGVLGRGGVPFPTNRSGVAAGVVGLAGAVAIPAFALTRNTGVHGGAVGIGTGVVGDGIVGVHGFGTGGVGVHGQGRREGDRGGLFQADDRGTPQVRLIPHTIGNAFFEPRTATPRAFPADQAAPHLPRRGLGGDLTVLKDNQFACTLWLCVRGSDEDGQPARWAQVLTGDAFEGTL